MSCIWNDLIKSQCRNLNQKIEQEIQIYTTTTMTFMQDIGHIFKDISCDLTEYIQTQAASIQSNYQERPENESTTMSVLNRKALTNANTVVRTVKNNKAVYTLKRNKPSKLKYKEEEDDDEDESDEEDDEDRKNIKPKKKNRRSIYRGVSRNGNQWQALIMINKKKKYIGVYSSEAQAGRAYDVSAIKNHGDKAKTNFFYSTDEINHIQSLSS